MWMLVTSQSRIQSKVHLRKHATITIECEIWHRFPVLLKMLNHTLRWDCSIVTWGDRGWLTQIMVDTPQISLEIEVLKILRMTLYFVCHTNGTFYDIALLSHQQSDRHLWITLLGRKSKFWCRKFPPLCQCCRLHVENKYDWIWIWINKSVLLNWI